MVLQMLYVHWKTVRWGLLPFVILAFGLPLLSVQGMGAASVDVSFVSAGELVQIAGMWQGFFPLLAGSVGALLALSAWNWDHKGGHIYALSLPLTRERYALLKFGAGAALAIVPSLALLAGGLLASMSVDLPAGLNAYPFSLASRFLFGSLVIYSVFFALASGTMRSTVIALTIVFGVPLVASVAFDLLADVYPAVAAINVERLMEQALFKGPFRVFFGDWMLIDV